MRRALLPAIVLLTAPAFAQIVNDECAGALPLSAASSTVFNTNGATLSGVPWNCAGGGGPDLWYTYTTTQADITLTIDTCGSGYDTALEVFSGDCLSLLLRDCNDDDCGLQSRVTLMVADPGTLLTIRVGGFTGATGSGRITVVETAPTPGPGPECVETLFEANNGGGVGGAVYFDLTLTVDHNFSSLLTNTSATGPVGMEVYTVQGGFAANAGSAAAWTLSAVDDGTAVGLGTDNPTPIAFQTPMFLPAGTWGVALVGVGLDHDYTNGTGTNETYVSGDGTMTLVAGAADNTPFSGGVFSPRVWNGRLCHDDPVTPGTNYCGPAVPNSTGMPGVISATGSDFVADNDVTLHATQLPLGSYGFFLVAPTQSFVPMVGGSQGNLCLGTGIGTYDMPSRIGFSRGSGMISLTIDLTQTPSLNGFVSIQAGETWNYQCWYRDVGGPAAATSNLTDGLEVTFR